MELRIWIVVILRWLLFITISNQYNPYILRWVLSISRCTLNSIVWFLSRSSCSTSHLHWFDSSLSTHLWWFLEATHLHVHVYVSGILVSWTLVRVPDSLVLWTGVLVCWIAHGVIVSTCTGSNVSVALAHSSDGCKTFVISFVLVGHEVASITGVEHCGCILISNRVFRSLQSLVFDEIIVSSITLNIWAVVPAMWWYLIRVLFTTCYYLILMISFLIIVISLSASS